MADVRFNLPLVIAWMVLILWLAVAAVDDEPAPPPPRFQLPAQYSP